ncbi:MAG: hypothetical protein H6Q10_2876, partial [Acidobacteria bacterium]|nr:hypothetical protein [Acidobacteriota bacterium]
MTPLLILGAGVFAEEVADLAAAAGFEVAGFVEGRDRERCGTLLGRPVHWIDELPALPPGTLAVCAAGSPARAAFIARAEERGVRFGTLVHPSAVVAASASIAEGAIVGAGVVIGAAARVGRHAVLNRGCLVGHHARLGEFATLGPGCNVGGLAEVGAAAFLGMGATVIDRVTIGEGATVAA